MKSRLVIGWREWAGLPDFDIDWIKAKIDTGAKTSSLHAYRIKKVMRDGVPWAEFNVHPVQRRRKPEMKCSAPIIDERQVKSSNGMVQTRLVVATTLELGPFVRNIELTLTNRDEMGFRLLIGRQALAKRFLVDSGMSYGLGEPDDA